MGAGFQPGGILDDVIVFPVLDATILVEKELRAPLIACFGAPNCRPRGLFSIR
jgi:hypothetical protein